MSATRTWFVRQHDGAICLSGYPVWIKRGESERDAPYYLCQEGREPLPYYTYESAKKDAGNRADILDEIAALPMLDVP